MDQRGVTLAQNILVFMWLSNTYIYENVHFLHFDQPDFVNFSLKRSQKNLESKSVVRKKQVVSPSV